ncbi:MAG: hypothetical protein SOX77_03525 [Candidatus Borkfalkiaceae bacterium]|nr:hypothetical protein [Christensenellaceae bacterium]
MNINLAFIGLLFLLYTGGEINSTELLLLLALISASSYHSLCRGNSQNSTQNSTTQTTTTTTTLN